MRFLYCGELNRTPDAPDHLGIRQGLQWLGWEHKIVDPILNSHEEMIQQICEFQPDVIVHGNTDSLDREIMRKIKENTSAKQVFWMLDYRPENVEPLYDGVFDKWSQAKGYLDAVFISNYDQIDLWSKAFGCPAYFLPHGCYVPDKLIYDEVEKHDCLFIGSYHDSGWMAERYHLLQEIGGYTHITEDSVEGRNQIWLRIPALYHSSNCVLDVSHSWRAKGYCSGRYWYIAGLGGCSITKRFPECEKFYKDKKEKLYFDTVPEAQKLIELCQKDEKIREEVKVNAFERNKKSHNYKVRFTELVNKL